MREDCQSAKDHLHQCLCWAREAVPSRTRILRDRETGVSYLQTWDGFAASITLLGNADGSPVVDNGAMWTRDA